MVAMDGIQKNTRTPAFSSILNFFKISAYPHRLDIINLVWQLLSTFSMKTPKAVCIFGSNFKPDIFWFSTYFLSWFLDFSSFSVISDVRTFVVARIKTADPSVLIHLSFEVLLKTQY
jgi:hypothetical protein